MFALPSNSYRVVSNLLFASIPLPDLKGFPTCLWFEVKHLSMRICLCQQKVLSNLSLAYTRRSGFRETIPSVLLSHVKHLGMRVNLPAKCCPAPRECISCQQQLDFSRSTDAMQSLLLIQSFVWKEVERNWVGRGGGRVTSRTYRRSY